MSKKELNNVIAEAKQHFVMNLKDTYVIKNDDKIYYCDCNAVSQLHVRDFNKGLNPKVIGYWAKGHHQIGKKFWSLQ